MNSQAGAAGTPGTRVPSQRKIICASHLVVLSIVVVDSSSWIISGHHHTATTINLCLDDTVIRANSG